MGYIPNTSTDLYFNPRAHIRDIFEATFPNCDCRVTQVQTPSCATTDVCSPNMILQKIQAKSGLAFSNIVTIMLLGTNRANTKRIEICFLEALHSWPLEEHLFNRTIGA
jgi:hypothetical protein